MQTKQSWTSDLYVIGLMTVRMCGGIRFWDLSDKLKYLSTFPVPSTPRNMIDNMLTLVLVST